ncbi:hypothetical protein ACFXKJ_41555, partial [Kitasatospora indigofera]
AARLATGEPIPVSMSPQAGPGQVVVRFPADAHILRTGRSIPGVHAAGTITRPELFTATTVQTTNTAGRATVYVAHIPQRPRPVPTRPNPALLEPADRELLAVLGKQPPLAEVLARLDGMEPGRQELLMDIADDSLPRTLVTGSEKLAARNLLWDEVQLRFADALGQSPDRASGGDRDLNWDSARTLARTLGLHKRGALPGGTRRPRSPHAASGPSAPAPTSGPSATVFGLSAGTPTTVIAAGVVAFSHRAIDTAPLTSLLSQRNSVTVILWVDHDGIPRIPGRTGTGSSTADAADLVQALARVLPDTYTNAEIIQMDVIGRTTHNGQAVHQLLEQVANLTQRPVWTAAGRPLRIKQGTLRAPRSGTNHGWEQILPPGYAPNASRWKPQDDGQLLPENPHPTQTVISGGLPPHAEAESALSELTDGADWTSAHSGGLIPEPLPALMPE